MNVFQGEMPPGGFHWIWKPGKDAEELKGAGVAGTGGSHTSGILLAWKDPGWKSERREESLLLAFSSNTFMTLLAVED